MKSKKTCDMPLALPTEGERDPVFHRELTLVQKKRFDEQQVSKRVVYLISLLKEP